MNFESLLMGLSSRNVQLKYHGNELKIQYNHTDKLEGFLIDALKKHKDELIALLSSRNDDEWWCPEFKITPDMLSMVDLTAEEIEQITGRVAGGARNVKDIYPLAPLQEGILFHHLMSSKGDPYLSWVQFALDSRERLDEFIEAFQRVVDRHDILRTGIFWEGLPEPVQVVLRKAPFEVQELTLDPREGEISDQLKARFDPCHYRLDVTKAPLLQLYVAQDEAKSRWVVHYLFHHLVVDHITLEILQQEAFAFLLGYGDQLPEPIPYRNYVAQARLGISREDHEAYFNALLGDVDEPTSPYSMTDVQGDGSGISETTVPVDADLSRKLRAQARSLGVSAASLYHLAWAQVVSRLSGREDVVFGTVLFGRIDGGNGSEQTPGLFINTLPVRIKLGEDDVRESVRKTHRQLSELMRHEHAPLSLAQRCSGVSAPAPLFTALLNYRYSMPGELEKKSTISAGVEVLGWEERTNFPFSLSVDDYGDLFGLTVQVAQPMDPQAICSYMHTALESLSRALAQEPSTRAGSLDILSDAERHQLLVAWNDTEAYYPQEKCIHELFEDQALRNPGNIAVIYEGTALSYGELNARSNRLAHYLHGLGVGPDALVAICAERSIEMVVGLLAILKAGGAYVPLDPSYPPTRLEYMVQDSAPRAILKANVSGDVEAMLSSLSPAAAILDLNEDSGKWQDRPLSTPVPADIGLTSRNLAYVIYTSGSTGMPKGVMITHEGVVNYLSWAGETYHPGKGSIVSSSLSFDATVTSLMTPLIYGSAIQLVPEKMEVDALVEAVQEKDCGLIKISPLHLNVIGNELITNDFSSSVDVFVIGGEALSPATVKMWQKIQPGIRLVNEYGPTETVVGCIVYDIPQGAHSEFNVPIGRPIANTQIYILDNHLQPVPIGVVGEIYIGGPGVGRGYLNQPELTSERFISDPFSNKAGARLYKTGDLGKYLPDGNIAYLGRNDFQIKLRGFRIELGEIEALLSEHPEVRDAVVDVRENGTGEKRLVAYYTAAESEGLSDVGAEALRHYLAGTLPGHMVPAAYVALPALPLTPNGKLDRKALPEPDGSSYASRAYEAPKGDVEKALATIWREVLQVEQVGRHDNFFELGGHSLLAVKLINRMRQEGLYADVRDLFSASSLSALAAMVNEDAGQITVPDNLIPSDCDEITPEMLPMVELTAEEIERIVGKVAGGVRNIQDIYPLAPLQEGILFHHLMASQGDPYLSWSQFSFDSREQMDAFINAFERVIHRHDILRTGVFWEDLPEPVQVVLRKAPLEIQELRLDPKEGEISGQLKERFDPRHYRLDVRNAPLFQVFIARDEVRKRWIVHYLFHHLMADHATLEILQQEAFSILLGREDQLPEPIPYRNYVAQARLGISREDHEAYFRALLEEVDEPTLPYGITDVQGDGSGITETTIQVAVDLSRKLRTQARSLGVSVASLHHLAWAQVVSQLSGREDVVFGTVLFGRMDGGAGSERVPGLFINTLPMRIKLNEDDVRESVRKTHAQLSELMRHEHAPLALAQRCSGVSAPAPLFSTLLNYRHTGIPVASGENIVISEGIEILGGEERTNYPFTLSVDDYGEGFGLNAQVPKTIDPEVICDYMHTALDSLSRALEQAPSTRASALNILKVSERHRLLVEWNATEAQYPLEKCIHQLFEEQVRQHPGNVAVVYEETKISYAGLNERSNRLAHYLRGLGVGPDSLVAICTERSIEMVVGLLGILKAGGAYVPLDPSYPLERLAYMVSNSAPKAILTHQQVSEEVRSRLLSVVDTDSVVLDLEKDTEKWSGLSSDNPDTASIGLTSGNLAYVIYTSGSTGMPKGVMLEHAGVVNRLIWMQEAYGLCKDDAVLQKTPFSFDVSVWEFFWTLLYGARLVMARPGGHKDTDYLTGIIQQQGITTMHFVPSMLQVFLTSEDVEKCDCLKRVICSGEALPGHLAGRFKERLGRVGLYNLYGPTEASVDVTSWSCNDTVLPDNIPIGRPVSNTQLYILDSLGNPVPTGVVGELHIGGVQLARGYLNQPELTADRFIPDSFSNARGARLYKTGDLAKYLPDGNIVYLGRNDFQVKIRGNRIELGEIEARLLAYPAVREAVVVACEDGYGDKRLVAYYTPAISDTDDPSSAGVEELRNYLTGCLPEYMVPAAYVMLAELPLSPNGKLDRKALPEPDGASYSSRAYEAPVGEVEEALARIWQEFLPVEQVGRQDNFFELGGHSLLAVKLINRMRQEGLHATVRDLFTASSLSALAVIVGDGVDRVSVPANLIPLECDRITPDMLPMVDLTVEEIERITDKVPGGVRNIQDIYPLAPLQEGILFHHLMSSEGDPYVLWAQLSFESREQLDGFLKAFQWVIDRHDILRTGVFWEGVSESVQVVMRRARLVVEELELDSRKGDISLQLKDKFDPRHYRLDVSQAPMLRVAVARDQSNRDAKGGDAGGRWVMHYLFHHLISDHMTLEILQHEAFAFALGQGDHLPEPIPYRNYVAQARLGISREEHEAYFRDLLGDVDEPTLPYGLTDVQGDGADISEATVMVADNLSQRLRTQARALGVSAASLCHLAWGQVVSRLSGREDAVFGTVLLGRMDGGDGSERVPGLFINTLPVRVKPGEDDVTQGVKKMHAQLSELMRHEHAPLSLAQRCSGVSAPLPLFSALLNYRHNIMPKASGEESVFFDGIEVLGGAERTNYPLTLSVDDYGEGFGLTAQVAGSIEPEAICRYMHTALESLASALEQEPSTKVGALNILDESERHRLLVEWNATDTPYPREKCIHELFEAQVLSHPDNIAVVCEETEVTYRELNEKSNRLAHYLRSLGVGPDTFVAICVERSIEMTVGLLGVLKAGGAYVPMDPTYPLNRLAYMIEDSVPKVILTHPHVSEEVRSHLMSVADSGCMVLDLEEDAWKWSDLSSDNLASDNLSSDNLASDNPDAIGVTSDHPAYMIYTSGSTGIPKGVCIPHHAVNRTVMNTNYIDFQSGDRMAQISNISFDAATFEVWGALLQGIELVIIPRLVLLSVEEFEAELKDRGISILFITTALFNQYVQDAPLIFSTLKYLLFGGEMVDPGRVRALMKQGPPEKLLHVYGPTETTTYASFYEVSRTMDDGRTIPIGRPLSNTRIYLLDSLLNPVPTGVAGEMYIGGDGVALEYLNQPELTSKCFMTDPFSKAPGSRMYKTGDLARYLPDGNIEFIGRNDFQVKIRGFRIELGEIEARLMAHPGVGEVVVEAREDSAGDKRLVAYYTSGVDSDTETSSPAGAEQLKAYLTGSLPDYMIPAAYVALDKLPITPNGKLDRKALPKPDASSYISRTFEAPQGEVEEILARIWCEILQVAQVSRHDNFFELGGHSLLAVRIINRMRQEGLDADVHDLFTASSLAVLADGIEFIKEIEI